MTQYGRPTADVTDGAWLNEAASAANLYASIDDDFAALNDADYIESDLAPANSPVVVALGAVTDPTTSTGHTLRWRRSTNSPGGAQIDLVVELREGYTNEGAPGTLIHTASDPGVPDAFADASSTLSGAEADAITDYSDLFMRFVADESAPPSPFEEFPIELYSFDGTTATKRFSAGIPLKPGMLTAANLARFRLFVGGVEQAIAVTQLYGIPFEDGSLRAIGVQCIRSAVSGVAEAGHFTIDPAGRSTVDIAWVEPTYASMQQKAVILPTEPAYLCATNVALVPLQPETDDSALPASMYGTGTGSEFGAWSDALKTLGVGQAFSTGATYEHVHGLFTGFIRSGDRQYYVWAYQRLLDQMKGTAAGFTNYYLPGSANGGTAYAKITGHDADLAAGVPSGNNGLAAEWNSNVYMGWVTGYWLTGWKQPWRKIAHFSNFAQTATSTYAGARAKWMESHYGIRFNTQWFAFAMLCGYMVEATMQVSGSFGGGRAPSRPWVTEVPWLVDAWDEDKYGSAFGAYLNGITGQWDQAHNCAHVPTVASHFPVFQAFIFTKAAVFYYNNIYPDSRIPTFLQTFADFVIGQTTLVSGEMRQPYEHEPPPATPASVAYYTNFYTELFGFVYAFTGNPTYKTWCGIAMNRAPASSTRFTKSLKAWGEFFGGTQQSGPYYYDGGAVRGIPGAHRSTLIEPAIHTS